MIANKLLSLSEASKRKAVLVAPVSEEGCETQMN